MASLFSKRTGDNLVLWLKDWLRTLPQWWAHRHVPVILTILALLILQFFLRYPLSPQKLAEPEDAEAAALQALELEAEPEAFYAVRYGRALICNVVTEEGQYYVLFVRHPWLPRWACTAARSYGPPYYPDADLFGDAGGRLDRDGITLTALGGEALCACTQDGAITEYLSA